MRQREPDRHLIQQRQDSERRLQRDRADQPQRTIDGRGARRASASRRTRETPPAQTAHRPSCDARTAPSAHCRTGCATTASRTTAARRRNERAVDLRPGVVDEARAQARDQRAEIKLHEGQREQHCACDLQPRRCRERRPFAEPPQASRRWPRKSEAPAPDASPADIAKPRSARKGPRPPSTSRPRPAARRDRRSATAAASAPPLSRRATGRTGTAADRPCRSRGRAAGGSIPTRRWS